MTTDNDDRCYIRSPLIDDDTGEPYMVQCCCNCKHHLSVHYHCTTEPKPTGLPMRGKCVCVVQKGWACGTPSHYPIVYDRWPTHSAGCEEYERVKPHDEFNP